MNEAVAQLLRCPLDPSRRSPLTRKEQELVCACGTRFPVKQGVPLLIANQADLPCKHERDLPCRKRK